MHPFHEFLDKSGFLLRPYSGRGMCGRECVAAVTTHLGSFICSLMVAARHSDFPSELTWKEIEEALRSMWTDSLGHDTVVYFPAIRWEDPED